MKQRYTAEQIRQCCLEYQNGKSVSLLVQELHIPRSTVYAWLKRFREETQANKKEISLKTYHLLENKVTRMENIIQVLQSVSCTVNDPLEFKLEALERLYGQYSVHVLCDALKVPRGTFYNYLLRNKRDNTWYAKRQEELRSKIQQIYDDHHQIFGAAKVTALLKEQGERVSVKMVRRLMQYMGLTSIRVGAKDLYDKEQRPYKNHLKQQFDTSRPNEVWVSDITYFRFNNKNYYICAIIDLYARTVVGYRVGIKNSTQLAKSTFKVAYENRKPNEPLLFHTDRGSNYRSKTFCSYLKSLNIKQSYSRAHIPYDNSVMESFFASLKREELYRTKYRSENEFKAAVDNYIIFYNERRPHAKNGYKTPRKKEEDFFNKHAALLDKSE